MKALATLTIIVLLGMIAWRLNVPLREPSSESSPAPLVNTPAVSTQNTPAPTKTTSPTTQQPAREEQLGRRLQYTGWIKQHMSSGALLMKCGTRVRADSGPEGWYVLEGFDRGQSMPDGVQIDFYARSSGVTTYASVDGGTR